MPRHNKRISPHCIAQISVTIGNILSSTERGFFGDGYIFRTALSKVRKLGYIIKYERKTGNYFLKGKTTNG